MNQRDSKMDRPLSKIHCIQYASFEGQGSIADRARSRLYALPWMWFFLSDPP
jgi:hypothetical protein